MALWPVTSNHQQSTGKDSLALLVHTCCFSSWCFTYFFNFHTYLGKIPILTSIFFKGVGSTTNQFLLQPEKIEWKTQKQPRSCDPKTRAHNRTWWFKAFLTSCRKVQLGTLSVSKMQWIFFVADTVDGSEVRDHHRKDALYKTCES